MTTDGIACTYSALILQDDDIAVTGGAASSWPPRDAASSWPPRDATVFPSWFHQTRPEKISTILKAANVEVEPYWPGLSARCLEGVNVKQLITNVGAASVAPAASAAAPAGGDAGGKKEEKKEESEAEDDDMVFGFFD